MKFSRLVGAVGRQVLLKLFGISEYVRDFGFVELKREIYTLPAPRSLHSEVLGCS